MLKVKCQTRFNLKRLDRFYKELVRLESKTITYGFYDEPHPSGLNIATLAAIHNFGWNGLPVRNFMETAFAFHSTQLQTLTEKLLRAMARGSSAEAILKQMGDTGAKAIQFVIEAGQFSNPTVSEQWAQEKGFNEAMRHYDVLLESATFKIGQQK